MSLARTVSLAPLLALLIASSAAAQASFTRITWKTEGQSLSRSGAQLVVEATGAARLERVFAEGALRQGTPESVLRGQLSPGELQALEAALRAPGLSQLPRQLRGAFSGPRLELSIERPGGRATLRAEGFALQPERVVVIVGDAPPRDSDRAPAPDRPDSAPSYDPR